MKRLLYITSVVALFCLFTTVAYAYSSTRTLFFYPTHNSMWLSDDKSHRGDLVYVSTNDCAEKTSLQAALDNMGLQTTNSAISSSFPDLGAKGYDPFVSRCDGTTASSVDIKLDFLGCADWNAAEGIAPGTSCTGSSNWGGDVYQRTQADAAWCANWSVAYPCGDSMVFIRFNKERWDAKASITGWQNRFVTHEFGHAAGFADYCTERSISNDGTSACLSGAWTGTVYNATDLSALSSMSHR